MIMGSSSSKLELAERKAEEKKIQLEMEKEKTKQKQIELKLEKEKTKQTKLEAAKYIWVQNIDEVPLEKQGEVRKMLDRFKKWLNIEED